MTLKHVFSIILGLFIYGTTLHAQDVIDFQLQSGSTINKGSLVANSFYVPVDAANERLIIRNTGTVPITLGLKVVTNTADWIPVAGKPDTNQFRLFCLFHKWDIHVVNTNDFASDDVILSEMKMASSNVFALPGEENSVKGFNIPSDPFSSSHDISLIFRMDTPVSIPVISIPVQIRILIKAQPYIPPSDEKLDKPAQTLLTPYIDGPNRTLRFPGLAEYLGVKKVFTVRIMDMNGRVVREISDKNEWDGTDASGKVVRSGVYIYQYRYNFKSISGLIVVAK